MKKQGVYCDTALVIISGPVDWLRVPTEENTIAAIYIAQKFHTDTEDK